MMGSLLLGMIHSCTIISSSQDQKLSFTSGSAAFTEGDPLTGTDSEASGTIKELVLESGSWMSGNAAGHLVLSTVSGTFQAGETIHDEHTGAAIASGPAEPVTNGVGTPQTTSAPTPYPTCRFSEPLRSGGSTIQSLESGSYIVAEPLLFLLNDAVIQEGDLVTSSVEHYEGPYKVMHVGVLYELFLDSSGDPVIDHYEVDLKAVEKRD